VENSAHSRYSLASSVTKWTRPYADESRTPTVENEQSVVEPLRHRRKRWYRGKRMPRTLLAFPTHLTIAAEVELELLVKRPFPHGSPEPFG
jgi:hypothetical protein